MAHSGHRLVAQHCAWTTPGHFQPVPATGYDASTHGDAIKRCSKAGGVPIKGGRRKAPEPKGRNDIGFGIGIAHGFATLGTIGFEGRFDYAAIGTVSNVASRLCDEAKPGRILMSPGVLMAVEEAVTVEPVGEFALKGIRRPLAACNVLAANSEN